jgi:hypothetical protein
VVGIVAAQVVDVHGQQGVIDEPLEELVHQIDVESADHRPPEIDLKHQARSPGEIDHHP